MSETHEPTLLRDVLFIVFKRKIPLIGLILIGGLILGYGLVAQQPEYEATARVMVKRVRQGYQMPSESPSVLKRSEVVNSELAIITSPAVAAEVVDRLGIATGPERGVAIEAYSRRIRAKAPPEADVIDISYRHTDPEWSALVVNTALDAYLEVRTRVALNYEAVDYLEHQAVRAKAARDSVATEIARLGGEKGDLIQGSLGETVDSLKGRLRNEQITLQTSIESREDQLKRIHDWLDGGADMLSVPTTDIYEMGTVRSVHIKLLDAYGQLADARSRYQEGHPEIGRLEREIASLETLLRGEVTRAVDRQEMRLLEWKAQKRAVDGMLADYEAMDADVAQTLVTRRMLEEDLGVRAGVYKIILDQAEQYRITAATDPSLQNVAVISRAEVPATPTPRPVNMRFVVGAFTIVFGVLLVFGLEKADHSLERREDVHRFLHTKLLASIPERRT